VSYFEYFGPGLWPAACYAAAEIRRSMAKLQWAAAHGMRGTFSYGCSV
jgi:hypothetical protein